MKNILMGTLPRQFADGNYQSVMFSVTEDCNLRCKYCYMTGKNEFKRISFETAKKIVDYALSVEPKYDAVAWEFIGGEPTLEMDLIDKIADYAKRKMFELRHIWFNQYIFNIGTNGILYDSPEMQSFIKKNATHVTVGITIDGNEKKHDLQRVTKESIGSYKQVIRNIPLWLNQMSGSTTKVTFASEDLFLLRDSIIHLWNVGLRNIPANVVFENVWKEGDDAVFEQQLRELADYILENGYDEDYSVRFFDQTLGFPLGKNSKKRNFCGSGKSIAFDCDGRMYPCVRFYEICQDGETICVGDIDHGVDDEKLALLSKTCIGMVNDGECADCSIANGCFACAGNNYRYTYPHTVYKRTKYNCKMHKANVRANEYFWDNWIRIHDVPSPHELARKQIYQLENWKLDGAKYVYFVLSSEMPSYCSFTTSDKNTVMTKKAFEDGVRYTYNNCMIPVYLGDPISYFDSYSRNKLHVRIDRYNDHFKPINEVEVLIPVFDNQNYRQIKEHFETGILVITNKSLPFFKEMYEHLTEFCFNIRVVAQEYWNWSIEQVHEYTTIFRCLETDSTEGSSIQNNNCKAGVSEFAYCPDQQFYPCPGFYYMGFDSIGSIDNGISNSFAELMVDSRSPDCVLCVNHNCPRCSLVNTLRHGMPNIPARIQCILNRNEDVKNEK